MLGNAKGSAALGAFWVLLLMSAGAVRAQVPGEAPRSVGVSAPDSTQPIRAYRLPSWHWSRWGLQGDGQADWVESAGTRTGLDLSPSYEGFWESERRTARLDFTPRVSLSYDENEEGGDDFYALSVYGDGTYRRYIRESVFVFGRGAARVGYENRSNTDEAGRRQFTNLDIQGVRVGVGIGRVRVVTPIVRALRIQERMRAVESGASMTDADVQAAAQQLARRPGYEAVYDRSDKYFWRDLFSEIGATDAPSPFDAFYVADVLREPVGVRREGAEIRVGPTGSYDWRLSRRTVDGQLAGREVDERGTVGGFVEGRWFRNVTLHHQLGMTAEGVYMHFVDSVGPLDHRIRGFLTAEWLWVIADRVRLDTEIQTRLDYQHDPVGNGKFRPFSNSRLRSDLRVFIENSLSLTVGGNFQYRYENPGGAPASSSVDAGVRFSVDYILSRSLE